LKQLNKSKRGLRFSNSISDSDLSPVSQSADDSPIKVQSKKTITFTTSTTISSSGTTTTTTSSSNDDSENTLTNNNASSVESTPEIVLQTLKPGDTFGELSFVMEGSHISNASIVAETDVVVNIIEGYYLDVLFGQNQVLEGGFYHHLAAVLETHLRNS